MIICYVTSFLLIVVGVFYMLSLSPFVYAEDLKKCFKKENHSIGERIRQSKKKKKVSGLRKLYMEVKEIFRISGKEHYIDLIMAISLILFIVGVFIGLILENLFLVPVLAIGLAIMPLYYVKVVTNSHKKQLNIDLETSVSVITTSYMRGNNSFIRAIEDNVDYLMPPLSDIFMDFLNQVTYVNPNMEEALENLKLSISNDIFHEWIDAVAASLNDNTQKAILPGIVAKFSDVRVVTEELNLILYEPLKEYYILVGLVLSTIPIMYFLNIEWYDTLVNTSFGKFLLAIAFGVIFISLGAVMKHMKPIEYKR